MKTISRIITLKIQKKLPEAHQTTCIEYFDSITFSSKQRLQQTLRSWSNFSLVLFDKEEDIHVTTFGQIFQKVENDENRFFAMTSSKL